MSQLQLMTEIASNSKIFVFLKFVHKIVLLSYVFVKSVFLELLKNLIIFFSQINFFLFQNIPLCLVS